MTRIQSHLIEKSTHKEGFTVWLCMHGTKNPNITLTQTAI